MSIKTICSIETTEITFMQAQIDYVIFNEKKKILEFNRLNNVQNMVDIFIHFIT